MIKVRYSSVDGYRKARTFKTHAGAKAFAVKMVGASPEMGRGYAVADDGVGKVTVEGCTLAELFGGAPLPIPAGLDDEPHEGACGLRPENPAEGATGWRVNILERSWVTDAVVGRRCGEVVETATIEEAMAAASAKADAIYAAGHDEHEEAEAVEFRGGFWRAPAIACAFDEIPF